MNSLPPSPPQPHSAGNVLGFVTCANDAAVLMRRLQASPCLADNRYALTVCHGATSAAEAFDTGMARQPRAEWLVWVHQDVFLPAGWDARFIAAIREAEGRFPRLAVVGVYGVAGATHAGHVLDRGRDLRGPAALPCRADSLDELLFAVRTASRLTLDPALGFDFYATDLALTAREKGFEVAVVEAYCEHWSSTPQTGVTAHILARVAASGAVFERKWARRLPLATPCFSISQVGDVAAQCRALGVPHDA